MNQKEYLLKLFSFLKAKNKEMFITWNVSKSISGTFCKIESVNEQGIMLSAEEGVFSILEPNKHFLARVSMLVSPILCNVISKQKNKIVFEVLNIVSVDREKRRFLRIYLDKSMDGTIAVSNIFFPIKIVDISEGGAGILAFTDRDITAFVDRTGIIQMTLFGNIIKLNMRFVWINKIYTGGYFAGVEFLVDNFQKSQIQKLMIDEMYNIEQIMLDFLSFL